MNERTLERLHLALEFLDWNMGAESIYVIHIPEFGTNWDNDEQTLWFGDEDNYTTYNNKTGEIISTTMGHENIDDLLLDLHEKIDELLIMIKHGRYMEEVKS